MLTSDDLRFAAEWMRAFDDSHDGGEDMKRAKKIAEWLDEQADAKDIRTTAKELGISTAKFRDKMKAQS